MFYLCISHWIVGCVTLFLYTFSSVKWHCIFLPWVQPLKGLNERLLHRSVSEKRNHEAMTVKNVMLKKQVTKLYTRASDNNNSSWGWRICFPKKFSDDIGVADTGTTFENHSLTSSLNISSVLYILRACHMPDLILSLDISWWIKQAESLPLQSL